LAAACPPSYRQGPHAYGSVAVIFCCQGSAEHQHWCCQSGPTGPRRWSSTARSF
jgi:hypothetical protein